MYVSINESTNTPRGKITPDPNIISRIPWGEGVGEGRHRRDTMYRAFSYHIACHRHRHYHHAACWSSHPVLFFFFYRGQLRGTIPFGVSLMGKMVQTQAGGGRYSLVRQRVLFFFFFFLFLSCDLD